MVTWSPARSAPRPRPGSPVRCCARSPSARRRAALYAGLHAVAAAASGAIAATVIPGVRARDLAAAAAVIGQACFTAIDDLVQGFGGGYLPPVVPSPGRPLPAPGFMLAAGMTVVVQPNVVTRDGHAGVQAGELLLATGHGPERQHAYRRGLQQAG